MVMLFFLTDLCPAAASPVVEADTEAVKLLTDLEIVKEYEAYSVVTKAEFGTMLNSMLKGDISVNYFADDAGQDPITYAEAVAVMIDVTGYSLWNAAEDGRLDNFILAGRIGLTDGIGADGTQFAVMKDVVRLFYNALTTELLSVTAVCDSRIETSVSGDRTLLSERLHLSVKEGVVTETAYCSLKNKEGAGEGKITIEDQNYDCNAEDAECHIGRYVKAYINEDGAVVSLYATKRNKVLELNYEQLMDVPKFTVKNVVYEENGKERFAKISELADVIYCGTLLPEFTREDLLVDNGSLTLIDYDGNGIYDVILAERYHSFVVSGVGLLSDVISARDGSSYNILDFRQKKRKVCDREGEPLDVAEVNPGDVLSLLTNRDGVITKIIRTRKIAGGIITKIEPASGAPERISIEDETYQITREYQPEKTLVRAGVKIKLYLDYKDEVVFAEPAQGRLRYGYLTGISVSGSMSPSIQLKIYDGSGLVCYDVDGKIYYNGSEKKTDSSKVLCSNAFMNNGECIPQLIQFKADAGKQINEIHSADPAGSTGEGTELTLNYQSGDKLRYFGGDFKTLGSKYRLTDNTMIFDIPYDKDEEKIRMLSLSQMDITTFYNVKIYNLSEEEEVGALVIERTQKTWVSRSEPMLVVDYLATGRNAEGETVPVLCGYQGGKQISIEAEAGGIKYDSGSNPPYKGTALESLTRGSIVQLRKTSAGEIENIVVYNLEKGEDNPRYEYSSTGDAELTKNFYFSKECLASFGVVVKKLDWGIVVNNTADGAEEWNRIIPLADSIQPILYDRKSDKVMLGDFGDISVGDEIFLNFYNGVLKTSVVYKG